MDSALDTQRMLKKEIDLYKNKEKDITEGMFSHSWEEIRFLADQLSPPSYCEGRARSHRRGTSHYRDGSQEAKQRRTASESASANQGDQGSYPEKTRK